MQNYNLPTTAFDFAMTNWFLKFSAFGANITADPVFANGDSSAAAASAFYDHKKIWKWCI